jgi:N-acetyl-alpha-D-glucosaminyl L-malate synthase BshA
VNIAIICYASVGGSGVVATELAHALATRGHEVHLVSSDLPFRWRSGVPGLSFERVETPTYPLFRQPQYLLALTNTIVRLARRRPLDIVHAHYAVPHATAAFLADEILRADLGSRAPRTVTTLHGTDITLVGSDASFKQVVAFSIERSHGVTTVSESLKDDTRRTLGTNRDIRVIPNFLDCDAYRRQPARVLRERLCPSAGGEALVLHVSNFRPVKRVGVVLEVFRRLRERVPARLVLIGDGPDRVDLERRAADEGLSGVVDFMGEQPDIVPWLSAADLFLLPSSQESFGMAALEAMACEVPVVASRVGGLPEVIEDGVTGFLCGLDDIDAMVDRSAAVLEDARLREQIGKAAAAQVRARFCEGAIVPMYEAFYKEVSGTGH